MPLQQDETRTEQKGYDPSEYDEGYTEEEHRDSYGDAEKFYVDDHETGTITLTQQSSQSDD